MFAATLDVGSLLSDGILNGFVRFRLLTCPLVCERLLLWHSVKQLNLGERRHVFVNLNNETSLLAENKTSLFPSENPAPCCSVIYKDSVGIKIVL